jgi:hypothetical protein
MSTRGIADVVFCLDASASMQPCIEAVKRHISDFITGLTSNGQQKWDLRLDFVAHQTAESGSGGTVFQDRSVFHDECHAALYGGFMQGGGRFFTADQGQFQSGLSKVVCQGDEVMLVALDFCLDFPWRPAKECHRVVIMLTDEPAETGSIVPEQKAKVADLIKKVQDQRVMLFLVAPDSPIYQELASADKSEYEVVDDAQTGRGLAGVEFRKVLEYIGKSVSVSANQGAPEAKVQRGLFGQKSWVACGGSFTGR